MGIPEQIARYAMLPLPVESELGRCTMAVRDILALRPGSVIRLSNAVGSKVDLYAGGTPFASGELVRIGGSIAVRLSGFKKKKGE
jgi:flagellar motor switch protein FliN/FliY